jgi:hypothetical protein
MINKLQFNWFEEKFIESECEPKLTLIRVNTFWMTEKKTKIFLYFQIMAEK